MRHLGENLFTVIGKFSNRIFKAIVIMIDEVFSFYCVPFQMTIILSDYRAGNDAETEYHYG